MPRLLNVTSLKLHHRMLAFVGALVVFMTFVVKEQLQEPWKKNVDRLETAEYFYKVRFDSISKGDDISARLQKDEYDRTHNLPSDLEFRDIPEMITGDLTNLQRRLEVISLLTSEAHDKSLEEMRKRLSDDLNSCVKRHSELARSLSREGLDSLWDDESTRTNTLDLIVSIGNVQRGMEVLEPKAIAGVDQEKEHFALLAKQAGWWSIGFYCFGWALGLVGKLTGDDEVVEVSE